MSRHLIFAGMFLLMGVAFAQRAETPGLLLARADGVAGGVTETDRLRLNVALGGSFSAAPVATGQAEAHAGVQAPQSDRAGLLTAGRIARQLLELESVLEPEATDLAGNADGRIDAADVSTRVSEMAP